MYLINRQGYPAYEALTAQAVLNPVKERVPDSAQLFVVTKYYTAPARLSGDALSGMTGNGCICHLLSFLVKTDILKNPNPTSMLEYPLTKVINLSTSLTSLKLHSQLKQEQLQLAFLSKTSRNFRTKTSLCGILIFQLSSLVRLFHRVYINAKYLISRLGRMYSINRRRSQRYQQLGWITRSISYCFTST